MKNRKILIFGAAGSIGSELYRQLLVDNTVFGFDIDEARMYALHEEYSYKGFLVDYRIGDIRNKETVEQVISEFKPDIIFHAAAYKNVIPMQKFPREAVETNILGTLNIFEVAKKHQISKIVYISSDKAVNADNIMGWSKKGGELFAKEAGVVSVRFGNVMASRGSVLEIWQKQYENDEPLTVTDPKMERYFMTIPEAVCLLIKASEIGEAGQILILDMGQPVKIYDLALDILKKGAKEHLGVKTIGIRPGETLEEKLMSSEEEKRAKRVDNFWIL